MKVFYSDQFVIPLPAGHRFPIQKYALLHARVAAAGLVAEQDLCVPHAARDEEILRAHDAAYLRRVCAGELTPQEVRRIGLPWSPGLVERARRSCGATIEACQAVAGGRLPGEAPGASPGLAVNLAGGTHHAFRDHGEGYCVFNDVAIAVRAMQAEGRARRFVIIDCDVHQGNGTAAILGGDDGVFTFSIHAARNFPFHKEKSSLDLELLDGTGDETYLALLEEGLRRALALANAELAIYLAGADPYLGDSFGRMKLTKAGLAARDRLVLGACHEAGLPVAITMAGGYAWRVEDVVDIHFQTVRIAAEMAGGIR